MNIIKAKIDNKIENLYTLNASNIVELCLTFIIF